MKKLIRTIFTVSCFLAIRTYAQKGVTLTLPADAPARIYYGADRLMAALRAAGYQTGIQGEKKNLQVIVSDRKDTAAGKEGYSIISSGNTIHIRGNDASGALYGCLELADRIRSTGHWPAGIHWQDHPEMSLRGACIGMQKPALLPGRGPYEYPYTPENFPWFYDKALWIKYLDSMVNNRMNTLYLWNGHPFASLVRVADYPYAVEVDDATFKKNEEIYRFLTEEADRRGIWVIQLFYNIIVSKPFAEHHHIKTQDRNRHIVPLIADYTRKSIAAFVEKYPHVGLMITLGEAMEGVGQDDIDWFTGTILPGIKDGLRALGKTELPPVVLRAHDTDGPAVMKAALPLYSNLYVEAKYNGEALTTYTPHGTWADLHRKLSSISKGLIENVHIMANLEPFRYGSADFIQKCVQAMHTVYGAKGLHLYPQASYWDWPYSADKTSPRLLEMDRDWIWYAAWARYAWNCHRDRQKEIKFWSDRLAARYGCDEQQGAAILQAYEQSGEIAPKLLRRMGITDGNRQTLTLGMLMTQLIDPQRYGLFTLLYESEGPEGETLAEYAEKEWQHQPHKGETPVQVCDEVEAAGKAALRAIQQAAPFIKDSLAEFGRLRNDMACYNALAACYAEKARAALYILRYKYSNDLGDLEKALPLLQNSLVSFRELSHLTQGAYRYANSMQTQQRKIPMRGVDGKYKTWTEMLPVYEKELADFSNHLDSLRTHPGSQKADSPPPTFKMASVQLITKTEGSYAVDSGSRVFSDTSFVIRVAATPLKDLKGIRFSAQQQRLQGTELQFINTEPVDLLVGFFDQKKSGYLPPPQLETDASANDYGQAEPKIINALVIDGLPPVIIHAWTFPAGRHTLSLGKGMCLVLGFIKAGDKQKTYDAGLNDPGKKNVDWLFESQDASPSLKLWYRQSAEKWTEALPIGNGRLGAMIFGGAAEDHLQFNESTLWSGGPRDYQRAGAAQYLGPIRQLIAAGQQDKAEALAEQHFMGRKDKDEAQYASLKIAWTKKVRSDTSFAQAGLDDGAWKEMSLPTSNGWETAGLEGVDGSVWFRTTFDCPQAWAGKDLILDLGRIRDVDFTYLNGKLVGAGEGISNKRHYHLPAALCKPGKNLIAIQVLNYDDKGGFTGVKGDHKTLVLYPEGTNPDQGLALAPTWKYKVQDEEPPALPKYEADYQPFGDLYLRCPGQEQVTGYHRELDIRQAIATTSYDYNGVHYTREYFASEPQQTMVLHIGADKKGKITLQALFQSPHRSFSVHRVDDHTLALFVKVRNGVLKGVAYLQVQALHGQTAVSDEGIDIKGADEVVFYLTAATSFVDYKNVSGDPETSCRNALRGLQSLSYAAVREAHIREYQSHFDAFSIDFGGGGLASVDGGSASSGQALPTDERIRQFSPEKDPALIALYMQYGRYLLISSSRPNSPVPANLQGLWNDLLTPPWGSKYTTNINLEMNYWLAEPLNLSDCSQPLFRLIGNVSQTGRLTAAAHYNAPGWVLHHNTDLWCGTAPINASNHGIWVTGGAWLCHQLWEHYQFTQDKNFLREYYPIMQTAAEFFTTFLVKDPRRGWLISTPSNSPEHGGLVAGPSMDHQLIRDLFKNCIAASGILHTDSSFRRLLEEKYAHLAPNQIGRYGQLQEWLEDKDDTADHHRHVSHLWGVYPGTDITWKDNPALMKAARQSLLYRGDDGTGWSLAWKANLWARMREGDHAMLMVEKLLSSAAETQGGEKGGVYPNLFDAHPPFQIDGNFGGAAGIAEMLLQSQEGTIDLLPALPTVLPDGEVKGICARGGFTLNIKWQQGTLQHVELISRAGGSIVLRYKEKEIRLSTLPGQHYNLSGELKSIL